MKVENKKCMIIDEDTGEVLMNGVRIKDFKPSTQVEISKAIVDKMIEESEGKIEKLDNEVLYKWCRIMNEINNYNQIKLGGVFRDIDNEKMIADNIMIAGYILKALVSSNKYSCFIKINHNKFVQSWNELYDVVGINKGNMRLRRKFKDFMIKNHLIRIHNHVGRDGLPKVKFVINPFLYRNSAYVGELAVHLFQDYAVAGDNISRYVMLYLESSELIDRIEQ